MLELLEDPESSINSYAGVLAADPALAGRVMKLANSAMFLQQRRVASLNEAIMTIGYARLRGLIISAAVGKERREWGGLEQRIWEHSLCTALAARQTALLLNMACSEELFLCGFFHDLGKLVFQREIPGAYLDALKRIEEGDERAAAEQACCGAAHSEVGADIAEMWSFPVDICRTIRYHHAAEPPELEPAFIKKLYVVRFADLLAKHLGWGDDGIRPDGEQLRQAAQAIGLPDDALARLRDEVSKLYNQAAAAAKPPAESTESQPLPRRARSKSLFNVLSAVRRTTRSAPLCVFPDPIAEN